MRVALYSAIYGSYDSVKPVPLDLGVPAYMYTDSVVTAEMATEAGWHALVVPHSVTTLHGDPGVVEPMLNHKWWKLHPDSACPNTDVSIWIDGSMTIVIPTFVESCLNALGGDDWGGVPHPERVCIYPEAELSARLARYDAASINAQAEHYRNFHPVNWGLFATGHIVRRHTASVLELCEHWWEEQLLWSHQDQISLSVLMRLAEEKVTWNMNIPWHQWWSLGQHGY